MNWLASSSRINKKAYKNVISIAQPLLNSIHHQQFRQLTFSFTGPKSLNDIIKLDKIANKTKTEVSNMWKIYHDSKEGAHGFIMTGTEGSNVLHRATQCPYFIQPVFRDKGYFMLLSQFQSP